MFSVFFASSIASAQNYQVRANRGLNLRESSSLQSRVVDTVRGGAILQVVGSFNRWLKIDRAGTIVWLADWTDHSRLDEPTQPATQASSQPIDNCCFVDRQCNSDKEWTDGYWAFQHGQCPVQQVDSSQPPTAGYAQPIGAIRPAPYLPVSTLDWSRVGEPGIDNCCQIGWDCINDAEWQQGSRVYQASQCHHSHIQVDGNANFKSIIEMAFEQLRIKQPHWYSFAVSGINRLILLPGYPESGGVMTGDRDFVFFDPTVWNQYSVYNVAGLLMHEACHVHQWFRGVRGPISWQKEKACVEVQILAGEGIAHAGYTSVWLREVLANIEDPAYWWWN